jgi:hypothetical protein
MKKVSDDKLMKIVFLAIAAFLVIGLTIFLFNRDGGASGAEVLGKEGGGFWFTAILFAAIGSGAVYLAFNKFKTTQAKIISLIVAAICLAIAFGKGCTDKANGGVTTSEGRTK